MPQGILEIEQLSKRYGSVKAIDNLSLKIPRGSVYGLLGPNGSGKTSILGVVLGVIHPSKGRYKWLFGKNGYHNLRKRKIGALLEAPNFYPYLSGEQNLCVSARIKQVDLDEVDHVLELVRLSKRRKSKYKTYSTGMKQRLAIAAALLGDPEVLVLDEPTIGLDPQGIAEIRNLIVQIAAKGKTIILASHFLDEVEKVCSHVGVLRDGKLISSGKVGNVLTSDNIVEVGSSNLKQLEKVLKQNKSVHEIKKQEGHLLVKIDKEATPESINRYLFDKGVILSHLSFEKQSLEEHFLALMEEDV